MGSRRLGWSSGAPVLASPAWFYDDSNSPKADGISCALLLSQMQNRGGEGRERRAGTATAPDMHWLHPVTKVAELLGVGGIPRARTPKPIASRRRDGELLMTCGTTTLEGL